MCSSCCTNNKCPESNELCRNGRERKERGNFRIFLANSAKSHFLNIVKLQCMQRRDFKINWKLEPIKKLKLKLKCKNCEKCTQHSVELAYKCSCSDLRWNFTELTLQMAIESVCRRVSVALLQSTVDCYNFFQTIRSLPLLSQLKHTLSIWLFNLPHRHHRLQTSQFQI